MAPGGAQRPGVAGRRPSAVENGPARPGSGPHACLSQLLVKMSAMGTQLSLLDLIVDPAEPVAGPTSGGDPRVAAARASLGRAIERKGGSTPSPNWTAVRLDADTCELGRRRVARAREVIAEARRRAEAEAQAGVAARQRAALAGAISAGSISAELSASPSEPLSIPARRARRSPSAA